MKQFLQKLILLGTVLLCITVFASAAEVIDSGYCGEDVTWILTDDGVLSIDGTGEMEDYAELVYDYSFYSPQPWSDYLSQICSARIGNGVTTIGGGTFYGCNNLKNVAIGSGIIDVGYFAFENCHKLETISVDTGNMAYFSIDGVLFSKDKTELVKYPPGNARMSYQIPESVTTIADYAFYSCKLREITIPHGIIVVGEHAFSFAIFTSISIPSSVISIGRDAFWACYLTEVIFKGSAPTIYDDAFYDVTATCFYPADDPTWTTDVMQNYGGTLTWKPYTENKQYSGVVRFVQSWTDNEIDFKAGDGAPNIGEYTVAEDAEFHGFETPEQIIGRYALVDMVELEPYIYEIESVSWVESKTADIRDVSADRVFFDDGSDYPVASFVLLEGIEKGQKVLYHTIDQTVVAIEVLEKEEGRLQMWDAALESVTIEEKVYFTNYATDLSFLASIDSCVGWNVYYWVDFAGYLQSMEMVPAEYEEIKKLVYFDAVSNTAGFDDGTTYVVCGETDIDYSDLVGYWVVCKFRKSVEDGNQLISMSLPLNTNKVYYKQFSYFDTVNKVVYFVDQTSFAVADGVSMEGFAEDYWVKCTVQENINHDSVLIAIEKIIPTFEVTVRMRNENDILYKDGKLGYDEDSLESKSEFEIYYEVTVENTTAIPGCTDVDLAKDPSLTVIVEDFKSYIPDGFNAGWLNGGSIDDKDVTLQPGGIWSGTGYYIRPGTFFVPQETINEYWLRIEANSENAGTVGDSVSFVVRKVATDEKTEVEEVAKELENISSNVMFQMLDFFDEKQAREIGELLLCEAVMASAPEDTFEEVVSDKILTQIFGNWKIGVSATGYTVPVKIAAETKYGELVIEFSVDISTYGFDGKDSFALYAPISYSVIGGKDVENVPIYKRSGKAGQIARTNVEEFAEGAYELAKKEIEKQYNNTVWGDDVDKVSSIIFGETVTKILKERDTSYKKIFFKIITAPAERWTVECPVDVFVYDADDNLKGSIVDNMPNSLDSAVNVTIEDGKKTFYLWDRDYRVELVASGSGTMRITIEEYAGMDDLLRKVSFDELQLGDNVIYSMDVTNEVLGDTYILTDQNSRVFVPDSDVVYLEEQEQYIPPAFIVDTMDNETRFVDISKSDYYYDAVLWAVENGITTGTSATTFSPDIACTRAQAVTFLWRAAGSPASKSSEMPFGDVSADAYYYDAVLWAVEKGITKGTSDTTFSPNAECTRAQIVTFLWRSQNSPSAGTSNSFTDVDSKAYYAEAVCWAVEKGITNGTSATTFSPSAKCTRAHIVTFLYRCLG